MNRHMLRIAPRSLRQWLRVSNIAIRSSSSQPPPPARSYQKAGPYEPPPPQHPPIPEYKPGFTDRLFSRVFKTQPIRDGPQDPARGVEATKRVVTEGVLDPRYKQGGKVYTRLIVALPIAIYTTWELYRRRFLGVQQKEIPAPKAKDETQDGRVKEQDGVS